MPSDVRRVVILILTVVWLPANAWASQARVFVTSGTYSGDLVSEAQSQFVNCVGVSTGPEAADCICQQLADAAGMFGSWKAWICDDTEDADSRLQHHTDAYVKNDGFSTVVANNWTGLASSDHLSTWDYDELGNYVGAGFVWTNCDASGHMVHTTRDCQNWTSGSSSYEGTIGDVTRTTGGMWTYLMFHHCAFVHRLNCVEQNPTLINLSAFDVRRSGRAVAIRWQTASEVDTIGFNLWRAEGTDRDQFLRVNAELIPSEGSPVNLASYELVDTDCTQDCFYRLEEVVSNGQSIWTELGQIGTSPLP